MEAVPSRYWIFRAPAERHLVERLKPRETESWVVDPRFAEEVADGDVVYLWQVDTEAALFGWATVKGADLGPPTQKAAPSRERARRLVELRYEARFDPPITRTEVRAHPALADLDVLGTVSGTNFVVEPRQAIALNELAAGRANVLPPTPPDPHPMPPPQAPVTWERLSPAAQDVMAWAAAAEAPSRVGTRGVLIGLLRTSQPTEAAALLDYCGVRREEVFDALQAVRPDVRITPGVSASSPLTDLPPLTPNARRVLDVAGQLQDDPHDLIEPRHLFGSILQVEASRAATALDRVLDSELLETVRSTYPDYLRTAATQSYAEFLARRLEGARPSTAITTDTWTDSDQLEHALYADAIAEFIRDEKTKAPLTIGIKAPWGAGKTSLMRMIRRRLDPEAPERPSPPTTEQQRLTIWEFLRKTRAKTPDEASKELEPKELEPEVERRFTTIWFNAWKYQSSEQLWAGLAHAILSQVGARLRPLERDKLWASIQVRRLPLTELRRGFYRYVLLGTLPYLLVVPLVALGVLVVWLIEPDLLGGASVLGAIGAAATAGTGIVSSVRDEVTKAAPTLVEEPDYASRLGFLHLVDSDMHRILELAGATQEQPFVIFVDDLDRCSYTTVAEVIEALNVFLAGDFDNCIFVIAMEPDLVAAQIHIAYEKLFERLGENESASDLGWRFLEKMVQLPLALPEPQRPQVEQFLDSILGVDREALIAEIEDDSKEVVEARAALRAAETTGSLEGIADAIEVVQANAEAAGTATARTRAVLQKAGRLEFKDQFSDAHARAMLVRHAADLSGNPREIKRFVNVFRFYAYVDFWRRTQGLPTPGLEGAAKLARIAIGWPSLLSTLARDVPHNGAQASLLAVLEEAADDAAWERGVKLAPQRNQARLSELRAVVGRKPHVGETIAGFL